MRPVLKGGRWSEAESPAGSFRAFDPESGDALAGEYPVSSPRELAGMVSAALDAAAALEAGPPESRATFFEGYAAAIERHAGPLAEVAHVETALPIAPRLTEVEIPRTVRQLRLAAAVVRDDAWRSRVVDEASRLVSEYRALGGPVLVIAPGNFPFAFNAVAGGDFAAALAVGNPVIAKGHPGHPETTRRLAELCHEAVVEAKLPRPSVQMFYHCAPEAGLELVANARLGAVAFTGSRRAGLALKAAADRAGVPFYAEMSSANPVFVLPGALAERGAAIAAELFASFMLGCGQFCTKPALVVVRAGEEARRFLDELERLVAGSGSVVLVGASARDAFLRSCGDLVAAGAARLAVAQQTRTRGFVVEPTVLHAEGATFLRSPRRLQAEAFGPMTLVVTAEDDDELVAVARALEGGLTASVYVGAGVEDDALYAPLSTLLVRKAGRFMTNKMPTGVVVSPAMHHGGPFPATGHPFFTSVGMPRSLLRFCALKCFDNVDVRRMP